MRCQPGDIAIVVKASNSDHLGATIEVIESAGSGHWLISVPWDVNLWLSPDRALLPIRPEPDSESESSRRIVEAA